MEAPPSSPGALAGLVGCMRTAGGQLILGALITKVNGNPVKTDEDLLTIIEEVELGSAVQLTVARKSDMSRIELVTAKTIDRSQLPRN